LIREVTLNSLPGQGRYIVAASYLGEPRHPDWYLNLQAHPEAHILDSGKWVTVTARDAQGEERSQLWAQITGKDVAYSEYQERTSRQIPVVILEYAQPS